MTGVCLHTLAGHEGEISKVAFNPQGTRIITASSDKTCRLWDVESGDCLQVRPDTWCCMSPSVQSTSSHCSIAELLEMEVS